MKKLDYNYYLATNNKNNKKIIRAKTIKTIAIKLIRITTTKIITK